ncbi:hypothetical protein DL768_008007 [Monosporascus sp. mg162]|nr:hypothetical protein DL768_008007 [Monosporascus sp. mg162]
MSADLEYWRNNTYKIAFQNHAAGIVFSGSGLTIDGHGTGLIDGNGDAWYGTEQGKTRPGRPMPFVFWNISDVDVSNFKVLQPPLWAVNIMNGTRMKFDNILVNATSHDAPPNTIWTGNTDGFDTMDARDISLSNFVYRGGDDCVAIKPRSYGISIKNVTCVGGNGVAIGSLGQYLEDSSVEDVVFDGVSVIRDLQNLRDSAYIKTWMGELLPQDSYESGGLPRGGGWGLVRNITFRNFRLHGPNHGPMITQNAGNNGRGFEGTSKMEVRDVLFENWTGFLAGETRMATFGCSFVHPCSGIEVRNVSLLSWSQGIPVDNGTYN